MVAYLLELVRCIVLNPVRAGIVADAGDWVWNSDPAILGRVPEPPGWRPTGCSGSIELAGVGRLINPEDEV